MGSLAASLWESNNTGDSLNSIFKKPLSLSLSFHLLNVSLGSEIFWKPQLYMLDALVEKRNGGRRSGSTKMGITHRTAGDFCSPGILRVLGCRI